MYRNVLPTDKNLVQVDANDGVIKTSPYAEYVTSIANRENLLAEIPADLARSVVACVLRSRLKSFAQALVLASTKEMVRDYTASLELAGIMSITAFTGDTLGKRRQIWDGIDVICATPDIFLVDMERGAVCPEQFEQVVLVDGNMARGNHNLLKAARILTGTYNCNGDKYNTVKEARILSITNSLPSIDDKDMLEKLRITYILELPWYKPDETLYPKGLKVEHVLVPPSLTMIQIGRYMIKALRGAKKNGDDSEICSILRVLHVLEAHGIESFLNSYRGIYSKITDYFLSDEHPLAKAVGLAQEALNDGLYHTKVDELVNIIKSTQGRVLVIADQNDSARTIKTHLCNMGISAALLPERETCQTCAELTDMASKFRSGRYKVLVVVKATDAYGGLLIHGDAHTIVCYVNDYNIVQSALGCGADRVVVLVTKGSDEDSNTQPLVQQDQKTRLLIDDLRREL